jgi:hypothetical protein
VPRDMYLDGPRERFWEDEGDDARGRLYAIVVVEENDVGPGWTLVKLNWQVARVDIKKTGSVIASMTKRL